MNRAVFVGDSHIFALAEAAKVGGHALESIFVCRNEYPPAERAEDGRWIVPEPLMDRVREALPAHVISVVGGNAHNVLGLLRHEEPFDFVLPQRPDLPNETDARLLPVGLVRAVLKERMSPYLAFLTGFRSALGSTLTHIESPPPIGDDEHCRVHLEEIFKTGSYAGRMVAGRVLRYKLWRLHSTIMREFCDDEGIGFVPAPAAAMDEHGFLRPEGFPPNATHANKWYGELVLRDLDARARRGELPATPSL